MGGGKSKLRHVRKENPARLWQITTELGSGTYGKVHRVRNRETRQEAAAKVAPIQSSDQLHDFADEIEILATCDHENITHFFNAYFSEGNLWIIIELCAGGSLNDIMKRQKAPFSEPQIRCTMQQMLSALAFLHSKFIIHRDLNASNTLLATGGIIKLADFGVSALCKSAAQKRSTFIGSCAWMAPEVVACENDRSHTYNAACDVWSLAVTAIELAETKPPHHDLHPMKILFKIASGPPPSLSAPENWSGAFPAFLTAALVKDPVARPTAAALLAHPFVRDARDRQSLASLIPSSRTGSVSS